MKQNVKRVLLVLCMVTCLFSLSACTNQTKTEENTVDVMMAMALEQQSQLLLEQFASMDAAQMAQQKLAAEESGLTVLSGAYDTWANTQGDLGALVSIDDASVRLSEDIYMVDVTASFEQRKAVFTVGWEEADNSLMVSSISIAPEYTTGEKLEKAGLNTLLGMGTVFVVLIFISIIIGSLKFVNKAETGTKAPAPAETPIPVPAAPAAPAENLVDDLELVAVITAAIAAATGQSADGLVVRSIKRKPGSTWKRR